MYVVLAVAVAFSWQLYSKKGKEMENLKVRISQIEEKGDPEELLPKMQSDLQSKEGERTFNGILLTFLGAGLAGIFFVLTVLPLLAQGFSQGVIGSGEKVEKDVMSGARSMMAQGDYHGAIEAFKEAAQLDPLNRLPWVEIVKIYKDNLEEPAAAIQTIRHALESQAWEVNDAAYFLFRLAELYDEVEGDRASAIAIMNQVVDQFPGTRHSANATHKLHEWSVAGDDISAGGGSVVAEVESSRQAEEDEYIARLKRDNERHGGA